MHKVDFFAVFARETTLVTSCLVPYILSYSRKESTPKGKNMPPKGANSYL